MNILFFTVLTLCVTYNFLSVNGLECYVCTNQEDNDIKCLKTIATCDYGQDVCLTEIRWGSTPYWDQAARKQFYVTKRCATRSECQATRQKNMAQCTHLWYQDWKCSDCCRGDRCNYYVINVGSRAGSSLSWITFLSVTTAALVYFKLL